MPKIVYTEQARADIKEIWFYIAEDSFQAADRFFAQIHEKCEALSLSPEIGRERPELAKSIRSFPLGNYLIFYHIEKKTTVIDRVLSGYRNLPDFFL